MNNDTQIKHHIFWIGITSGLLKRKTTIDGENLQYQEFISKPLEKDLCEEIDALVKHIKENY